MRCGVNRITTENQERLDLARLDISAQFRQRFQVIHRMRFHWLGVVECCPHVAERRVDGMRQSMNFSRLLFACDHQRHARSEEHTPELQSQSNLVCRLLLEKKNSSYSSR